MSKSYRRNRNRYEDDGYQIESVRLEKIRQEERRKRQDRQTHREVQDDDDSF